MAVVYSLKKPKYGLAFFILLLLIIVILVLQVKEDFQFSASVHFFTPVVRTKPSTNDVTAHDVISTATQRSEQSTTEPPSCQPKRNVVYVKTHKTASSAVQNILMRYGVNHDLNFCMPKNMHNYGYPAKFRKTSVAMDQEDGGFNILCHHARFDYDAMRAIMPVDSLFVTIVREPLALYESTLRYFRPIVPAFRRIATNDSIEKWFDGAADFIARSPPSAYDHFTRDHVMFDLGVDHELDELDGAIARLDKIFDLVMVADHMDESSVLLSELLCWPLRNFACLAVNARVGKSKMKREDEVRAKVREWNAWDAALFDHFNATLWRRVDAYGRDRMRRKVDELRQHVANLSAMCLVDEEPVDAAKLKNQDRQNFIYKPPGVHMSGYNLKPAAEKIDLCRHLVAPELAFSKEIFHRQQHRSEQASVAQRGNHT